MLATLLLEPFAPRAMRRTSLAHPRAHGFAIFSTLRPRGTSLGLVPSHPLERSHFGLKGIHSCFEPGSFRFRTGRERRSTMSIGQVDTKSLAIV